MESLKMVMTISLVLIYINFSVTNVTERARYTSRRFFPREQRPSEGERRPVCPTIRLSAYVVVWLGNVRDLGYYLT